MGTMKIPKHMKYLVGLGLLGMSVSGIAAASVPNNIPHAIDWGTTSVSFTIPTVDQTWRLFVNEPDNGVTVGVGLRIGGNPDHRLPGPASVGSYRPTPASTAPTSTAVATPSLTARCLRQRQPRQRFLRRRRQHHRPRRQQPRWENSPVV